MTDKPSKPPVTPSSLRVSPESFDDMVDRSAGGPAYRRVIVILKGIIAVIAVAAIVGVVVTLIALAQFSTVLDRLDEGDRKAEDQREILLEQAKVLLECTTPSPPAGEPLPEGDDGKHECFEDGQARTGKAVSDIVRAQIALAECAQEGAPDLAACARGRLG